MAAMPVPSSDEDEYLTSQVLRSEPPVARYCGLSPEELALCSARPENSSSELDGVHIDAVADFNTLPAADACNCSEGHDPPASASRHPMPFWHHSAQSSAQQQPAATSSSASSWADAIRAAH
eukprot:3471023-Pleurochrysis_carterae.AAC.1